MEGPETVAETRIYLEFPSCVHVEVTGTKNERSAVQLARNAASRHYDRPVDHYVSSGGGPGDRRTYVFSNPND